MSVTWCDIILFRAIITVLEPIGIPVTGTPSISFQFYFIINPKMDMPKIVTLDGFGVRTDPRDHFGKNAT